MRPPLKKVTPKLDISELYICYWITITHLSCVVYCDLSSLSTSVFLHFYITRFNSIYVGMQFFFKAFVETSLEHSMYVDIIYNIYIIYIYIYICNIVIKEKTNKIFKKKIFCRGRNNVQMLEISALTSKMSG